jgi:branched-chain amino acid transport system substrate-binding protein
MTSVSRRTGGRRRALLAAASVAVLTAAVACGGSDDSGSGGGGSGGTYTFAFLTPLSGSLAQTGVDMRNGAQVALDEINADGGAGGTKLAMQVYDDKLDPTTGTQLARKAVSSGQKVVVGVLSSAVCLAVAPVVDQLKGVFIGTTCSADELVGTDRKAENFYGVTAHNTQMSAAISQVIAKEYKGLKTVDAFGYDYVVGHELYDLFTKDMATDGVQLQKGQEQWVPLTSVDYRAQVAAMARALPDAKYPDRVLWLSTYGAGTTSFLKQAAPLGLTTKYAAIATSGGYAPGAWELGGTTPPVWDAYDYEYAAAKSAENTKFVQAYQKVSNGRPPTSWSWEGYMGVKMLAGAIEKGGSTDVDKINQSLPDLTVSGPTGDLTVNPDTHEGEHDVVVFQSVGDKSAPQGLKVTKYYTISHDNKITGQGP